MICTEDLLPPPAWRDLVTVSLIAMLAHAPAIWGEMAWLDHAHLGEGLAIYPLPRLWQAFVEGFAGTGYYRPLVSVSLSLDAALLPSAWFHHLVTLAWHSAAAALLTRTTNLLGFTRLSSVLAGTLFASHPATGMVAGLIAFRSESMAAVFWMLMLGSYVKRQPLWTGASLLAASLCKETTAILGPLSIVALELARDLRSSSRPIPPRSEFATLASVFVACGLAIGLRCAVAPQWRAQWQPLAIEGQILTRLASVGKSTLALILPIDGKICDASAIVTWRSDVGPLMLALLGTIAFAWVLLQARQRDALWLLLLLSALPILQLVPVMRWWSPHYLYLPLLWFSAWVGHRLSKLTRPKLGFAIPAALAVVSFVSANRFGDDRRLFTGEVAAQPMCREAHFYLAEADRVEGNIESAIAHYEAALAHNPLYLSYVDRRAAWQNLGAMRLQSGQWLPAKNAFAAALSVAGSEAHRRQLRFNLAVTAYLTGDRSGVLRLLQGEQHHPNPIPQAVRLYAAAASSVTEIRNGSAEMPAK